MQSREITRVMTEPQAECYECEDKFTAFCGGYGVGKSQTLVNCAIRDALHSSSALVALYEPTFDLVRLILAPRMQEALTDFGIAYKYNKQENIIYTSSGQCGDFVMRTMENPERIVGYESYRAHIDELDTLKRDQAAAVWTKIIARNRQKPKGLADPFNRVSVYTTPEGFRFVHEKWGRNPKPGYRLITASTYSNPFLPDDYIDSLKASYPAGLIDAYIEGKFTNLTAGSVYPDFDRKLNHADEFIKEREALHIGMDFNRLHMAAVVYVMRNGNPVAVEEITDGRDTPYMAKLFNDRYVSKGHPVQVYPDASGQNSSSKNASESDLTILRQAGLTVRVNSTNPAVQDRVNSVNSLILNGEGERRLKINTHTCPKFTEGLEQQAYDKNGQPDKSSGVDHVLDGGGYPLAYLFPIKRKSQGMRKISGL